MLNVKDGTVLAVSSTAPFYSAAVTVPLVVDLVGGGAAFVYVLAVVPILLVCAGMAANDRRDPDRGTVYLWMRRLSPRWGWFGGWSLAVTGIVATSGQAYVAVESLVPDAPAWVRTVAGAGLIVAAGSLSMSSVKLTSWVQTAGIALQGAAAFWLLLALAGSRPTFAPVTGDAGDWVHAMLLAVFAYWGFDSVFALTDESEERAPLLASFTSLALLIGVYAIYAGTVVSPELRDAAGHPLVVAAVAVSSAMSLGSTILPTARGISAMAERGDLPRRLTSDAAGVRVSMALAVAWLAASFLHLGLFEDSVEALSVFVGIYFAISSYVAWRLEVRLRRVHLAGLLLIGLVTLLTAQQTFAVDYGSTSAWGVGGVGLIVAVLLVFGAVLAWCRPQHRADLA